jgi:hypothetical protein
MAVEPFAGGCLWIGAPVDPSERGRLDVTPARIGSAAAVLRPRGLPDLVEGGHLLPWLHERAPFTPSQPPVAPPMERGPIPKGCNPDSAHVVRLSPSGGR